MKKTTIAMINAPIHPIPPSKGAAVEWWMLQVSRRLQSLEPHIFCLAAPGQALEEKSDGVHFHRARLGRMYRRLFQKITRLDPWSYAHRMARAIDRLQPDILHVHNAPALLPRLRALCRWQPRLILHHMHNAMELETTGPDIRLLVNSHWLQRWYAERHPRLHLEVITNGVDLERFQPRWESSDTDNVLRRNLTLPADHKIVLFVGRISPEKGPLDLVQAFEELIKLRPDTVLVIVGERRTDPPGNPRVDYGNAVHDACARLGDRCRFVGLVSPSEIQHYYRMGDLLVVPSEFEEPFGMVAIEGMAAGVPVLAARKGGLPEFVIDGNTGYLIENTKDRTGFARRIADLLDDSHGLASTARTARSYVERHHGWGTVTRQFEDLCRRLLTS